MTLSKNNPKVNSFFSLSAIQGSKNHVLFHRKKGKYCTPGVYFWGFTLREDCGLPQSKEEMVMYYVGKSKTNISERIMQEVTQLIFGGFGTIIDHNWLRKNYSKARIKQEQDKQTKNIIYTPEGLHTLYNFYTDKSINKTLSWMKDRLIFTWIDCSNIDANSIENEMFQIIRTNVLGVGNMKNLLPKKNVMSKIQTPLFHQINWKSNIPLKEWIVEVNINIP